MKSSQISSPRRILNIARDCRGEFGAVHRKHFMRDGQVDAVHFVMSATASSPLFGRRSNAGRATSKRGAFKAAALRSAPWTRRINRLICDLLREAPNVIAAARTANAERVWVCRVDRRHQRIVTA